MKKRSASEDKEVVLYKSDDGRVFVDVRIDRDTVWLSQSDMVSLFGRDQSVISRHVRNIFKEKELPENSNMQKMHIAPADKPTTLYSLDVIISVGYRVKSRRGTQFRVWATRVLREHLLRGFSLNERRLGGRGLREVEQAVDLLGRTLSARHLVSDEGQAVLEVVQRYTHAWRLLLEYDEHRLPGKPARPNKPEDALSLDEARSAIRALRKSLVGRGEAAGLFGSERGHHLEAILGAIEQTFEGEALYSSVQERAAHLLYFVIKDHPFVDGNKRIGALLFLEYLRRNGMLLLPGAAPRLADNAVVALALLIAESDAGQKDLMVRLVVNLLEDGQARPDSADGADAGGTPG